MNQAYLRFLEGVCHGREGELQTWTKTVSAKKLTGESAQTPPTGTLFRTIEKVSLSTRDVAETNDWVLFDLPVPSGSTSVAVDPSTKRHLGRISEILQVKGSPAEHEHRASAVLIRMCTVSEAHNFYHMPKVTVHDQYILIDPKVCLPRARFNPMWTNELSRRWYPPRTYSTTALTMHALSRGAESPFSRSAS